jgi:hypothetical protein
VKVLLEWRQQQKTEAWRKIEIDDSVRTHPLIAGVQQNFVKIYAEFHGGTSTFHPNPIFV